MAEINVGDNNIQDNAAAEFAYHADFSATCFFSNNQDKSSTDQNPSMLRWANHPYCHVLPHFPSRAEVLSSSQGLTLLRIRSRSPPCYKIGNPFLTFPYLDLPHPDPLHPLETESVIITTHEELVGHPVIRIISFVPVLTSSKINSHRIDIYSSVKAKWESSSPSCHLLSTQRRHIILNSGVSCGRCAYWLARLPRSRFGMTLIVVDPNNFTDPEQFKLLNYVEIPQRPGPEGRVQLGRMGDRLGLVVCTARSTMELYVLNQMNDRPFKARWTFLTSLIVVVDSGMQEGAVEVMGENQILCREMPEPLRFESFKMELLLLVGGRQLVLWEGSDSSAGSLRTRLRVINGREAGDEVPSFVSSWGVPHVTNSSTY